MPGRFPSLESLRFLEASGRLESFSRAAAELHVSPAAVSLRIRDLEADLGVPLFHRRGPRVAPTEACAALTAALGHAFAAVREAVETCRVEGAPLRVTASPTFAARWLAPRLGELTGAPPVTLEASSDLAPPGEFDVAIRAGRGGWPGLRERPLFPVEGSPMLSPALAASRPLERPEELANFPLLPDDRWPRWFAAAGVTAPPLTFLPMKFANQDLTASAVMQGHAAALLAPRMFRQPLREGALVQPFAAVVAGPDVFHVAWREADGRATVRHFVDWLTARAARAD
jgi:LysR family transcriptional regulator, glycine cleavage system transcriptional activator